MSRVSIVGRKYEGMGWLSACGVCLSLSSKSHGASVSGNF